ncbi:MTH1187 family thiamine-binding protein [Alteribacillus iranensis]|uniref:Uncharacterized protein, MTH1187 family n=1 Tax=Alteribacillus iranensis TaxID=930128 RepID=A0A1I1ZEG4_9BACI|nr:MTH1187 family thiamine-binding protein [Alteribacillus iranensis]SFE30075.1 uncharacterized protein, MTH1187 family [Alteribacillus iranensis]
MKGLSYQKGVIFIGEENIGWAYAEGNRTSSMALPLEASSLLRIGKDVFFSMPFWYKLLVFSWGIGSLSSLLGSILFGWPHLLPVFTFFYLLLGTHFIFPAELRKFHGAEHKIFSFKGVKNRRNLPRITRAKITNRYCSTNTVVLYFLLVVLFIPIMTIWLSFSQAAMVVSYSAVAAAPILHRILQMKPMTPIRKLMLQVSYLLQRRVTCSPPERIHLLTALEAYRTLAKRENPHLLHDSKAHGRKKEEHRMAIIDLTVVPIGTESTSMSEDVAEIQKVLDKHSEHIDYQLTSMSTIIEGELKDLFPIVQELHEIPFNRGAKRVSTNIRIDDRRDSDKGGMDEKVSSVKNKI